jgi:small subunit ribosomal protein S1
MTDIKSLYEKGMAPLQVEMLVEGPVIEIKKSAIYIDLRPFRTGIIFGREFMNTRDIIKKMNIGDIVKAKIVAVENEDGYVELSLKEAKQALIWSEAEKYMKAKTPLDVVIKDANKGGLILDWQGIVGFLPCFTVEYRKLPSC